MRIALGLALAAVLALVVMVGWLLCQLGTATPAGGFGALAGGSRRRRAQRLRAGARALWPRRRRAAAGLASGRVLFPYSARALSPSALDAALRLARSERATLVPVCLAQVPLRLPLQAPLPRQAALALPLQEAIEQRAARVGVAVDQRIERGRSHRHALRRALSEERFDRIVLAAAPAGAAGFGAEDVAWLLEHAPGEIVVLRPAPAAAPPGDLRRAPAGLGLSRS